MPTTRGGGGGAGGLSEYEQQRNERIRANEQALAALGIFDAVKAAKQVAPKDSGAAGRKRRRRHRRAGADTAWDSQDSDAAESEIESDDEGEYFGDELVAVAQRKATKRRLKAERTLRRAAPRPSRAAAKAAAAATRTAFTGESSPDEGAGSSGDDGGTNATDSDKESDFSATESSDSDTGSESSASESEDQAPKRRRTTRAKQPKATDIEEVEEYEVEKIVDMRFQGDKTEYRVRWAGWASSADTWEPEDQLKLTVAEMITQYHHGGRR